MAPCPDDVRLHPSLLFAWVVVVAACGPTAPPVAVPVVSSSRSEGAPAVSWWFVDPIVPDGETLLADGTRVAWAGRRRVVVRDEMVEDVDGLAPDEIVDMDAEGLAVGAHGLVMRAPHARAPLQPLGRFAKASAAFFAVGRGSALALSKGGHVSRTRDGAHFAETRVPLGPTEQIVHVASDRRGRLLAVTQPQRAYLSVDDGATFTALATPGIGVSRLRRDAAGILVLLADGACAELVDALVVAPCARAWSSVPKPHDPVDVSRLITLFEDRIVESRTNALGRGREGVFVVRDLAGRVVRTTRVEAPEVAVHVGEGRPVLLTFDDHRPLPFVAWSMEGTILEQAASARRASYGAGFAVVSAIDGVRVERSGSSTLVAAAVELGAFVHDVARDRLWVIGGSRSAPSVHVTQASSPELGAWTVVAGTYASSSEASLEPTDGSLRLLRRRQRTYTLLHIDAELHVLSQLHLPDVDAVAFAGARGLASVGGTLIETADGGEHWTTVDGPEARSIECNANGCLLFHPRGTAFRRGWALPFGHAGGATPSAWREPPPVRDGGLGRWTCVGVGAGTEVPGSWLHTPSPDQARWATHRHAQVWLEAPDGGLDTYDLGPTSTVAQPSMAWSEDGLAVAHRGGPPSYPVELVWVRPKTRQVHRATFATTEDSADAQLVDAGDAVAFVPVAGPVVTVTDGGSIRLLPRTYESTEDRVYMAARTADAWWLATRSSNLHTLLRWSTEGTLSSARWQADGELVHLSSKIGWLSTGPSWAPLRTVLTDPPIPGAPLPLRQGCRLRPGAWTWHDRGHDELRVDVDGMRLLGRATRVRRRVAEQEVCDAVLVGEVAGRRLSIDLRTGRGTLLGRSRKDWFQVQSVACHAD